MLSPDRSPTELLYGFPPPSLSGEIGTHAQCSPLVPGAIPLDTIPPASVSRAVVHAPPGSLERRYVLACTLRALATGGSLLAMAHNKKGGTRLRKEMESFGLDVEEDASQHFRVCRATRTEEALHLDEALAGGMPQYVEAIGLWSQPGIFSWDRIDPGSALLLRVLPSLSGRVADLGCGIGVLSRAALSNSALQEMHLVDIDGRAIAAARRNVDTDRARFHWQDAREVALPTLDHVLMNPPFHEGGHEDRALGQQFLLTAARMLRPGGTCWLTANRHLPYEIILQQAFQSFRLVCEEHGYKVYEARR